MNRWALIARLTKDPELGFATERNGAVARLSLAYNHLSTTNDEKDVSYFTAYAYGKKADVIGEFFTKGQRIGIDGEVKRRFYKDKNGEQKDVFFMEIDKFTFIEKKEVSEPEKEVLAEKN